jgi:LacI family transcriptional regulator
LEDVARAAGVSLATASRVLNGSSRRVADSYRQKVEAAASELGYSANLSAQATARGTSAMIALLVADIADPYFGELAAGVARGAEEAGLVVTIAVTERSPERELRLLRELRGQRPRGIILAASRTSGGSSADLQREGSLLESAGGRLVALGHGAPGIRSIAFDNRGGALALGRTLTARGYRRAIVLAAAEGVVTSDDRVSGFVEAFDEAGLEPPRVLRGGFSREAGRALMASVLADGVERDTVVLGISDVVAIGAMAAVRAAGKRVGDEIAIAGFDDIATSRDVTPALTTVRMPLESIGYAASRAAVDAEWHSLPTGLEFEVSLRESTPVRS